MNCPKWKNLSPWQKKVANKLGGYPSFKQMWRKAVKNVDSPTLRLLEMPSSNVDLLIEKINSLRLKADKINEMEIARLTLGGYTSSQERAESTRKLGVSIFNKRISITNEMLPIEPRRSRIQKVAGWLETFFNRISKWNS